MLVIWTILFLFFLLLSVHPFVTYPLSLLPFRRRRPKTAMPETLPTFAICVCAYNEEATIAEKARNMIAVADTTHDCELLVYVDGASDRTAERLAPFSDRITVVVSDVRRGKSHGMNVLVERCRAEIIVFTDANVDSFALVAVSGGATFSGIPNGTYVDAITGDVQNVGNGSLTASVNGKGNLKVYVLNGPGKIGTDGTYLKP